MILSHNTLNIRINTAVNVAVSPTMRVDIGPFPLGNRKGDGRIILSSEMIYCLSFIVYIVSYLLNI